MIVKRQKEYDGAPIDEFGHFKKFKDFWHVHLKKYVDKGIYDERIFKVPYRVARDLYNTLIVDYIRNNDPLRNALHYQIEKFMNHYLIEYNNEPIETFEEVWFLQSLLGFLPSVINYGADWSEYKEKVITHFKYLSEFLIVPATPQMMNLRKKGGNLSSCFILDVNDTTESIVHTQSQIALISRNAGGVGLYLGKLRPSNSWIKGNKGLANSISEWIKLYETTIYDFNQGGKRKGSITMALPVWHKDIFDFLEAIDTDIGNPTRKSPNFFPQVVIPGYFFKYLREGKDWYLIDLHEITEVLGYKDLDLNECGANEEEEKYNQIVELIKQGKVKNYRKVNPREIIKKIFYYWNRKGVPYIFFKDNANIYGPYDHTNSNYIIHNSNLCIENLSPFKNTNPKNIYCITDDELGYIHTCNITNVNLLKLYQKGILFDDKELYKFVKHLYEYMDNLLDLADIPIKESKKHNQLFRTVTSGFIGLADLFALLSQELRTYIGYRMTYRTGRPVDDVLKQIDRIFGRFMLLAVLSSTELAEERGAAPLWKEATKYKDKIILGRYDLKDTETKEFLQNIFEDKEFGKQIVEKIERNLEDYGIRNTLLANCPPNTSTSILAGATAGILPPYHLYQLEEKKQGIYVSFVPLYDTHKLFYDTYTGFSTEQDYENLIDIVSRIQEWIDSGISFEITVNHNHFDTSEKLTRLYTKILAYSYKKGIKALYYIRHILKDGTTSKKEECENCAN
jgi:ribonucleoside-diphosphate reductase alpha chain